MPKFLVEATYTRGHKGLAKRRPRAGRSHRAGVKKLGGNSVHYFCLGENDVISILDIRIMSALPRSVPPRAPADGAHQDHVLLT